MPQGAIQTSNTINPSGVQVQQKADAQGAVRVATGGVYNSYNITAATVVKSTPGRVAKVSVVVAGSGAGTVNDCATTAAAAAANEIAPTPTTAGVIPLDWPCTTGIVVVPGTGQTLAVSYS